MKHLTSLLALTSLAIAVSGCANPDGKVDNDRIHGAVGVGMASQNMSRLVPTARPGIEPPPSSSSSSSGATASATTPFIPGQTSY